MNRSALLAPVLLVGLAGCGGVITYEESFVVVKAPADDEALTKWVEEQPGVRDVSVTRDGKTIHVRYSRYLNSQRVSALTPPFKELGYETSPGISMKISGSSRLVAWLPDWVVLIVAVVAGTALTEGVRWLLRRRKRAEPQATADGGRDPGVA
jgi:hypothetical protein